MEKKVFGQGCEEKSWKRTMGIFFLPQIFNGKRRNEMSDGFENLNHATPGRKAAAGIGRCEETELVGMVCTR